MGWGKALRWELMKLGYFLKKLLEECTDSGKDYDGGGKKVGRIS